MSWLGSLRRYMAHDDPAAGMANLVAMVVGWNGPLYPVYVIAIAGWQAALPAMLTALAAPFFLAIPALSRRSSLLARLALPVVGTVNTLWCIKVLGPACGLQLFFVPCILLASLMHRPGERLLALAIAALAAVANFLPAGMFGEPIMALSGAAAGRLAALNQGSVIALAFFMTWQFLALLRALAAGEVRRFLG